MQIQEQLLVEAADIIPYLENSVSASPDDAGLHLAIGSLYINVGVLNPLRQAGPDYNPPEFKSAEEHLEKAARLSPQMYLTQYHLGLLALHRQDLNGALQRFKKAIALTPRDVRVHQKVHTILITKRQYATAALFLEDSIKALPGEADLFYRLAITYLTIEDIENARSNANIAIALGYGPEAQNLMATINMRIKNYLAAEHGFKGVLKTHPGNINAMLGLTRLYLIKDEKHRARRWLGRVMAIEPQNQEAKALSTEVLSR